MTAFEALSHSKNEKTSDHMVDLHAIAVVNHRWSLLPYNCRADPTGLFNVGTG